MKEIYMIFCVDVKQLLVCVCEINPIAIKELCHRDSCLRKETYIYEKRPMKETRERNLYDILC